VTSLTVVFEKSLHVLAYTRKFAFIAQILSAQNMLLGSVSANSSCANKQHS
jgi:hypothetical protein